MANRKFAVSFQKRIKSEQLTFHICFFLLTGETMNSRRRARHQLFTNPSNLLIDREV